MAIQKNFVIKNGLEVDTNLILADPQTNKVGIGTTVPQYTLHVNGGIGVTNAYVSGITTVINELRVGTGGTIFSVIAGPTGVGQSVGVGTANPAFLLDVRSPVSTGQTALYVQGDIRVTGDLNIDDISITNLNVSGISTFVGFATFRNNIFVAGIGTITTLNSTSGTITNLVSTSGTITTLGSTNGTITNLVSTSGTITTLGSTNGTITNLVSTSGTITNLTGTNVSYSGISTLGTVRISSGIITATSGIVTYFGDGQYLNLSNSPYKGIGIGTTGGLVGYGITFLDLKGAGVSTTFYNSSVGIATIFFEGGGGSGSIGIGSTFTGGAANGDLFYHIDYGRIFVYYDEVVLGIGTDAFWVDAAPFNVGIITSLTNVSFSPGSAVAPSMFFIGDNQTGFFSPGNGQFTVVSSGSSVLNVNASGIRVTGVTTITNASGTVTIGIGTTALLVEGNARVTGILTVGSSSITLDGTTNTINVGTGLTLSSGGINVSGVITATSFSGNGSGLTGAGSTVFNDAVTNQEFFPLFTSTTSGTITASGISTSRLKYNPSTGTVTATAFIGSGAGLTGAGSTVADDTSTNATFYPVLTQTTSGTITASKVSTTKLTFNPSTGTVTATTFSGALTGTASSTTNIPNLTGDVTSTGNATSIAAGVIVNADINASAGIVDTKLATIATAGKVSNSATTATNANTASAIVARDASGNFSAGTITAALTGNSSSATTASACSGNSATATTASACSGNSATATTASACSGNSATATTASACSGNSATATTASACSGNSATATAFQTARTINGISFNGSANIDVNPTTGAFSNGQGAKTIQSGGTASGGSSGDIFYIY